MQCGVHSDREAVGMCVDCGTYICVVCLNKEAGKLYCDTCVQLHALSAASSVPQQHYQQPQSLMLVQDKNKVVAGVLALLAGSFGIHKFYLGQTGWGIMYALFFWTGIPSFMGFIEGIIYLTMRDEEFARRFGRFLNR